MHIATPHGLRVGERGGDVADDGNYTLDTVAAFPADGDVRCSTRVESSPLLIGSY